MFARICLTTVVVVVVSTAAVGFAQTRTENERHERGPGRGPGVEMRADQEVFHFLLKRHADIRRTVKRLENGVETLTESDDPQVATKIQEHVVAMHRRIKDGRGLRFWDELFAEVFRHHTKIQMKVEKTKQGVKTIETSDDPFAVVLIQAHADVVSKFVDNGFDEAHENHSVPKPAPKPAGMVFPTIESFGGVISLPKAAEQPRAGAKVVLDVTADAKPTETNKGLERAARLLNLYGAAGHKASDVKIALVLHGEATKAALRDDAFESRFEVKTNPNLPLIAALRKAGVEVFVCGQALHNKKYAAGEVAEDVSIAASALTVVINKQSDGYASIPIP